MPQMTQIYSANIPQIGDRMTMAQSSFKQVQSQSAQFNIQNSTFNITWLPFLPKLPVFLFLFSRYDDVAQ